MFGFLKKDPKKELQTQYEKLLKEGMLAQRNGDIKTYSMLTAEAEKVFNKIKQIDEEETVK